MKLYEVTLKENNKIITITLVARSKKALRELLKNTVVLNIK